MSAPYELFEQNMPFAVYILTKYYWYDEDLLQAAYIGLWKACLTYDSEKAAFSTYAAYCIGNSIRMELRKCNRYAKLNCCSLQEPTEDDLTLEGIIENSHGQDFEDVIAFQDAYNRLHLTELEARVLHTWIKYKHQTLASTELGMSQSYLSRILERIRRKLHEELGIEEAVSGV